MSALVLTSSLLLATACQGSLTEDASGGSAGKTDKPSPTSQAPAPDSVVTMTPASGAVDAAPNTPITLAVATGKLKAVTVTNEEGTPVTGALSESGMSWSTAEPLGYGRTYNVAAESENADGKVTPFTGQVSTLSPETVTLASITPGTDGAVVGVGQPVVVHFDEPVTDRAAAESNLIVTTNPPVAGRWSWFDDQNVHYRPEAYWPANTQVTVDAKIYGVNIGDGIYGQQDTHVAFTIGDAMIGKVDHDELVLRWYLNGALISEMPTSMGKASFPTESGSFVIQEKYETKIMDSSTYGLPTDDPNGYRTEVDWAVRMSAGGIFLHSAPWSVGDQGVRNVSHGCLNLAPENAIWVYDSTKPGDIVEVTNTGVPLTKTNTYGDWMVPWAEWIAGSALG